MKPLHFSDNATPIGNSSLFSFWLNYRVSQFVLILAQSIFDSYSPLRGNVLLTKPVLHSLNSLFTVCHLIFCQIFTNLCRGDQTERSQAALPLRLFALAGVTALHYLNVQINQSNRLNNVLRGSHQQQFTESISRVGHFCFGCYSEGFKM